MRSLFKPFIIVTAATVLFSCSKTSSELDPEAINCRIDKVQSYGISSATTPDDFYFIYNESNKLIQINGIGYGTSSFRGVFSYVGSDLTKIEIYSLGNSGELELFNYLEILYSGGRISNINNYEKYMGVLGLYATITYGYNNNGQRIKKVIKHDHGSGFVVTSDNDYTYDNLGNIISIQDKDSSGLILATYNYEFNNKINHWLIYHPQFDAFGWIFFDGIEAFTDNGWTDPRYLSKYQMVKEIISFTNAETYTYDFHYSYDLGGEISRVTSNSDINRSDISYLCQ